MASYYVLTPPGSTDPEKDTRFIRDGFSWFAFIFPLPWLVARSLWLIAGLSLVFSFLTVIAAEYWRLDGLPVAFTVILSLWAGLEGGHVRAHWLQRKGWDLKANVTANDRDEAEAIYFDSMADPTRSTTPAPNVSGNFKSSNSNSVALGLIGPYGGR